MSTVSRNFTKKVILSTTALCAAMGFSGYALAQTADEQSEQVGDDQTDAEARLNVVTVTATKRAESSQDVPVALQVLAEDGLDDLNVENFDDYLQYLPSVSSGGRGPGQSQVFIRGIATDPTRVTVQEFAGTQPTVALYLDEQPVQAVNRNLDVYITDIERVEVLAGPQGTLFGASAMAGAIRIITNKPDLSEFDAGLDLSYSMTKSGDDSNSTSGFVNIPIIEDKFAARITAYNAFQGGYIDNVPGIFDVAGVNPGIPATATTTPVSNAMFVEENFNDAVYAGGRLGLTYAINDDWSINATHSRQTLQSDGVFDHDPENVGDLQVQRFAPDSNTDEWNLTSVTVEGRFADLDLIYSGAYLDREIDASVDYSAYSTFGPFIPYYICNYPAYTECLSAAVTQQQHISNTRETHEFRMSTPSDNRLSFVGGVFFDSQKGENDLNTIYEGIVAQPAFPQNQPIAGSTQVNPNPRPVGVGFLNDITREEEQIALFGEVRLDIIPDTLALTGGLRWYDLDVSLKGSSNFNFRGAVDQQAGINIDEVLSNVNPLNETDTVYKLNLTWTPADSLLFYATYSEGFRPGGFNRADEASLVPQTFTTDTLKNYEIGWKTQLLGNTLRWNGAIYQIDWSDIQFAVLDVNVGRLTFTSNVAEAQITGLESDFSYAATDNLTLFGAISYNDTELTDVPANIISLAPEGSALPLSPELQANFRVRYERDMGEYLTHTQLGVIYADDSFSSIEAEDRVPQDGYTIANFSAGVAKDNWGLELFAENIGDERATLYINTSDRSRRITTNRPRTIGLRLSYDY